jgi:hypothetical protein
MIWSLLAVLSMPCAEVATDAEPDTRATSRPAATRAEETFPPRLPEGQAVVTDTSEDFLRPPVSPKRGVTIARTPPTINFLYYPGQTYRGEPWSVWGDGLATQ